MTGECDTAVRRVIESLNMTAEPPSKGSFQITVSGGWLAKWSARY